MLNILSKFKQTYVHEPPPLLPIVEKKAPSFKTYMYLCVSTVYHRPAPPPLLSNRFLHVLSAIILYDEMLPEVGRGVIFHETNLKLLIL